MFELILAFVGFSAVAIVAFWLTQFVELIGRDASTFPSAGDKTIWIIGFFLAPAITAPAFVLFKQNQSHVHFGPFGTDATNQPATNDADGEVKLKSTVATPKIGT